MNDVQHWAVQIMCTGKGNSDNGCGAVILVEESDLFNTTTVTTVQTSFHCTECKANTDIDNVPESIFNRLPSRRAFLGK